MGIAASPFITDVSVPSKLKPKKRKKVVRKKRSRGYCIFMFGAKTMKGINRRSIESSLLKMLRNIPAGQELSYIVMGNVRETDKVFYAVCRKHHLPIAMVPSDFEKFSVSAESLRNGLALGFFKPSQVLIAHLEPEEESSVKSILRWAKHHGISPVKVGPKKEKE